MTILLAVLYGVLLVCLLIVLGVHPQLSSHSRFELQRRARGGDEEAMLLLKRHGLLRDMFSLQRVLAAILLVSISFIGVGLFHWSFGLVLSFLIALESGALARTRVLQQYSQKLYDRYEGKILGVIEHHPFVFRAIRSVAPIPSDSYDIESKEELLSMVEQSGDVLKPHEKRLIVNGLKFDEIAVKSIMTPRSVIASLSHDDLLGPVLLNELHTTGHSRFPVTAGDIDHIVGVLYVRDLLVVDGSKNSKKVSQVMDEEVCFIHESQDLAHALKAFIKTEKLLFVVVNAYRETVGVVTLEDVVEALIGQKINDEFEHHTDLRAVAEQNIRKNNSPKSARDV